MSDHPYIERILEDRLTDLLVDHTIEVDEFIPCVMADIRQECVLLHIGADLLDALRACAEQLRQYISFHHTMQGSCSVEVEEAYDKARAALKRSAEVNTSVRTIIAEETGLIRGWRCANAIAARILQLVGDLGGAT